MKKKIILPAICILIFLTPLKGLSEQIVLATKAHTAPTIDGVADDEAWQNSQATVTHDPITGIDIHIKAIYTGDDVFFLVIFPDPDESRIHKPWTWNKELKKYEMGPEREDTFIFKWNMSASAVDLSIFGDDPYEADIWFWKANRTDPIGFADDKVHLLNFSSSQKSMELMSKTGKKMYLIRKGDAGLPAYKGNIHVAYIGDKVPFYSHQPPKGSRGDVKAKGMWRDGRWTIEFTRKMATKHLDDNQFQIDRSYQFGISRHEIAGREIDPKQSQPLYGAGDTSENLILKFSK